MKPTDLIARNVRVAAARKDWTLTQVAAAAGMSKQALSHRLRGTTSLRVDELIQLAKALETSTEQLMSGVDETLNSERTEVTTHV